MARHTTKFTGVIYRDSITNGKDDKTYYIRYKDGDNNTKELKIGKYSEGVRENYCNQKRNEIITKLRLGEEPPAAAKLKRKEANLLSEVAAAYFAQRKENETTKSDKAIFEYYISPHFKDIDLIVGNDLEKLDKYLQTAKQKNNKDKTLSPKYQNDIKSLLGTINRYGLKHNLTKNDFTMYLKFASVDNDRERFLSLEEIEILYQFYEDNFQYLLFCKLALTTGGRWKSLLNIKKIDIDLTNRLLQLKNFKTDNTYTAFLKPSMIEILKEYTKKLKPNDLILHVSQSKLLSDLDFLFNDGIDKNDTKNKVVIHTLRHTFASHLAINGTPLYTISKLMDHEDLSMTQRYAKLSKDSGRNSIEDLKF